MSEKTIEKINNKINSENIGSICNASNVGNAIELVHSGEDYFYRLRNIILNAKSEIHLQTYIFENDSTGIEIADALKEAASRNVKVYVLLDGYGSAKLPVSFADNLKRHGVFLRFFSSFFSKNNFYLGRRLHHKVVVADGNIALIGGINIADKYFGTAAKEPWLDYAVQIEHEKIGEHLQQLCRKIYYRKKKIERKTKPVLHSVRLASVRILQNDWLKRKNEIYNSYITAIHNSKQEIIIVGSYFLPGRRLTNALKTASRRGVKIKLILSGISDVPLVGRAICHLYSSLLKQNIELYEWNKSVLHGKAALIDNQWTTIGSFNLNHLSSYGSIEMNVEIHSPEFSKTFLSELNRVIAQCENITYQTLKTRRGIFANTINWIAYRLVRMALIIITYILYKRFTKLY
ncbi:MAG: phospholipase D-like domain-containing protein [Bacteroidota bacterium]